MKILQQLRLLIFSVVLYSFISVVFLTIIEASDECPTITDAFSDSSVSTEHFYPPNIQGPGSLTEHDGILEFNCEESGTPCLLSLGYNRLLSGDFIVEFEITALSGLTGDDSKASFVYLSIADKEHADNVNTLRLAWEKSESGSYVQTKNTLSSEFLPGVKFDVPNDTGVRLRVVKEGTSFRQLADWGNGFVLLQNQSVSTNTVYFNIVAGNRNSEYPKKGVSSYQSISAKFDNWTITCKGDSLNQPYIYRFFNVYNGAHLYTISENEKNTTQNQNEWKYEGIKYKVTPYQKNGTVPVYRFFNTENGAHLYTIDENEKNTIINTLSNFQYEGIKYYVYLQDSDEMVLKPVYRFFNTENGAHLYTNDENEKNTIINTLPNFQYEGIKYYVEYIDERITNLREVSHSIIVDSPVLTEGTYYSQYSPMIVKDPTVGNYVMYYCKNTVIDGRGTDRIWRLESLNGLIGWGNDSMVIQGSEGGPDEMSCTSGVAIDQSGTWHMYYVVSPIVDSLENLSIYHATSTSPGKVWNVIGKIQIPEQFATYLDNPNPMIINGKIKLYFLGTNQNFYVMESSDGQNFSQPQEVLTNFKENVTSATRVLYYNGKYYMTYSHSEGAHLPPVEIGISTSTDGLHFSDGWPLFGITKNYGWDSKYVFTPFLRIVGNTFYIFYAGNDESHPENWWGAFGKLGVRTFE